MGEVYRARDTRLDRSVAIKILPAHLSADPARKLRFEREAKTVSALNHPNICFPLRCRPQDGTDYLVMECIEGENLADRLAKGPLPTGTSSENRHAKSPTRSTKLTAAASFTAI